MHVGSFSFLVGMYMLVYLGLICQENMQIEGFWYYLFTGVFEAATIHYAIAKIFGPLLFGRGWCGYACWTAMVLDFLPYKNASDGEKEDWICQIYHFCDSIYFCGSTFLKSHTESGKDYVYSFLLLEISCIMRSELFWHSYGKITGHFANTFVR